MNLVRFILPSMRALVVDYKSETLYSLRLITTRNGFGGVFTREDRVVESVADIKRELSSGPVVVILSGYGVIRKSRVEDEAIVNRVVGDSENFLYTALSTSMIRFVRLSQVSAVIDDLEQIGAKVIEYRCLDAISERPFDVGERATGLFARKIEWKELLKPSLKGSVLCMLICRRLKFPLLFSILLVLLINFLVDRSIRNEYATNGEELARLSSRLGHRSEDRASVDRLHEQYDKRLPYLYAMISDRIAGVVPQEVCLSQLAIQPLKKPLQVDQKPELNERLCMVVGQAVRVDGISLFLDALGEEKLMGRLKLRSIVQNTDTEMFHFVVEIEL